MLGCDWELDMVERTVIIRVDDDITLDKKTILGLADREGKFRTSDVEIQVEQRNLTEVKRTQLYTERFDFICKGAKYLLANLRPNYPKPSEKQALSNYISEMQKAYNQALASSLDSTAEYENLIHRYSRMIVAAISVQLNVSISVATKWLSKSEEYCLLTQPRPNIITLKKLKTVKGDYYVVQKEEQLPPFSDAQLTDLLDIATQAELLPSWYALMDPFEQKLLRGALEGLTTKEQISDRLINLSSRHRTIPGDANFRYHLFDLFDSDGTFLMGEKRPASSMISSRDIKNFDQEIRDEFTVENLQHIMTECIESNIEERIQEAIVDHLVDGDLANGTEINVVVPILVQTLISPLIPEYFQPDKKLILDKESGIEQAAYETVRQVDCVNKAGKKISITAKVTAEICSTNHPLNLSNLLEFTRPSDEQCLTFVKTVSSFLAHNDKHPKYHEIAELLDAYKMLLGIVGETEVLGVGGYYHSMAADTNKRELFLSSLEQLMFSRMKGVPYGSCVSAKDRKSLEFIHTDAIQIYHSIYNEWPSYGDTADSDRRIRFVDIFASLFTSRHHQVSAALNAPGSEGIKTPNMYLPADIIEAITNISRSKDPAETNPILAEDDRASLNELKHIIKPKAYSDYKWGGEFRKAAARGLKSVEGRLPQEARTLTTPRPSTQKPEVAFYTAQSLELIKLISQAQSRELQKFWNERTFFKSRPTVVVDIFSSVISSITGYHLSYHRPDGVKDIGDCFDDALDTEEQLTAVFNILSPRIGPSYWRYSETADFYFKIQQLFFSSDSPQTVRSAYKELLSFYNKVSCLPKAEQIYHGEDEPLEDDTPRMAPLETSKIELAGLLQQMRISREESRSETNSAQLLPKKSIFADTSTAEAQASKETHATDFGPAI